MTRIISPVVTHYTIFFINTAILFSTNNVLFLGISFERLSNLSCLFRLSKYIWSKLYLPSKKSRMEKKKVERDYTVDFCQRPLTQKGATERKVALDKGFVDWILANISSHIELSSSPSIVNICQICMNGFRGKNKSIKSPMFVFRVYNIKNLFYSNISNKPRKTRNLLKKQQQKLQI